MVPIRLSICEIIKFNTLTRSCSSYAPWPKFDRTRYHAKEIPKNIWLENKDPKYTGYEEVKGHWHYVEQLFPKLRIPTPPKQVSSCGWKAPSEKIPDLPYFVGRSRNHMLPVYLVHESRDRVLVTKLRKILGDIYVLEYDLKAYLKKKERTKIESHVNEIGCWITFKGDRVDAIKEWLYKNGF